MIYIKKLLLSGNRKITLIEIQLIHLALGFIILTGCTPTMVEETTQFEIADTFSRSGTAEVPDKWWTEFNDEQLNSLVDSALSSNFSVRQSYFRIQESQAAVRTAKSNLYPQVEGVSQAAANFPQPDFVGGENVRLGIRASYEVDLWGRINAQADAAEFRYEANIYDYQSASLSLSAEITNAWFSFISINEQQKIVREQIKNNENILKSLKNRYAGGQVQSIDILRQQQLIKGLENQLLSLENQANTIHNQLSLLLGKSPQSQLSVEQDSLPDLKPLPDIDSAQQVLSRRPDVRAAMSLLKAADRDLAAAMSNRYPRLSLNAGASLRSNNFNNLIEKTAWSIAANMLAPIFYGGRLQAIVDQNMAVKQQLAMSYNLVILQAITDIENALQREEIQKQRLDLFRNQFQLAETTAERVQFQYYNGSGNYLDVLTAIGEKQQLQRSIISEKLLLLQHRVSLYRAIAGGIYNQNGVNNEN